MTSEERIRDKKKIADSIFVAFHRFSL